MAILFVFLSKGKEFMFVVGADIDSQLQLQLRSLHREEGTTPLLQSPNAHNVHMRSLKTARAQYASLRTEIPRQSKTSGSSHIASWPKIWMLSHRSV